MNVVVILPLVIVENRVVIGLLGFRGKTIVMRKRKKEAMMNVFILALTVSFGSTPSYVYLSAILAGSVWL